MSPDDEYLTIKNHTDANLKIKGSRFIGTAVPSASVEQAEHVILKLNNKYHDATHNCYAFSVLHQGQIINRCNDDGEPAGTAGPPILTVIHGKKLLNVTVVITRYFGGTKLGKGGLIRAYTDTTKLVLDAAKIQKKIKYETVTLLFDYELTGTIMHLISQFNGQTVHSEYTDDVNMTVKIPASMMDSFKSSVIESSSDKVGFE